MVSYESAAGIGSCLIVILVLLPFLRLFHKMRKQEQEQEAGASGRRPRGDQEEAGGGGEGAEAIWEEQLPAAAGEQAAEPPLLLCTYRGPTGGGRDRVGCAYRSSPTARSLGCCRRACTTSMPNASASGSRRRPHARSVVLRSLPAALAPPHVINIFQLII
ncbi:unnamed protein product [Urochloa humidicola]